MFDFILIKHGCRFVEERGCRSVKMPELVLDDGIALIIFG